MALADRAVTYAELHAASNRAARWLRREMEPGRPLALLLPQGYDSVLWTLAAVKARCPYAPIDHRLPPRDAAAMMASLDAPLLLATNAMPWAAAAGSVPQGRVIDLVDAQHGSARQSDATIAEFATADSVAYVFYTSGSTGRPKGVFDSHRNLLHNILRYTNTLRLAPEDCLGLVQHPGFSGTVSSLFGALLNGAAVAPVDLGGEGLARLSQAIKRLRVTVLHAVPSIVRQLIDPITRFPHVRLVRLEGDSVLGGDVRHFRANFQPACTLVNGLGATECGLARQFFVDAAGAPPPEDPLPVGYAVPDVTVSIVDADGRPMAAGAVGEIVVESRFLALGYWNDAGRTAQRFADAEGGRRRYRTGDGGRLRADGCLMHLGRLDHRVRIAVEFVETNEIERRLRLIPGIAHAVVGEYRDDAGDRRLCADVVREPSTPVLAPAALRAQIAASFGAHAVPSAFVDLPALPLTRDMKVDRTRLPRPPRARPEMVEAYIAPATPLEAQITEVWAEVLEIAPVGVCDPYLALGGDSLRWPAFWASVCARSRRKPFQLTLSSPARRRWRPGLPAVSVPSEGPT